MTESRDPWSDFITLVDAVVGLRERAHQAVGGLLDETLMMRNWLIGLWIKAYEQEGHDREVYGTDIIVMLAKELESRGARGLGRSNLEAYREIALTWPLLGVDRKADGRLRPCGVAQLLSSHPMPPFGDRSEDKIDGAYQRPRLSTSHLLELVRIGDPHDRFACELKTILMRWSVTDLRDRHQAKQDAASAASHRDPSPAGTLPSVDFRDPHVLEFLDLHERGIDSDIDLHTALVRQLQEFLLGLSDDFCLLGPQHRRDFVDLLFFHRRLRCLVAIDLDLGRFTDEHAARMISHLDHLRENVSFEHENLPVGLMLRAGEGAEEVRYVAGQLDRQVFVSRYLTQLPTEEQLRKWLAEEREMLARQQLT